MGCDTASPGRFVWFQVVVILLLQVGSPGFATSHLALRDKSQRFLCNLSYYCYARAEEHTHA